MSKMNNFRAGSAKVDITPALGSIIGVDFFPQFARNIHDNLYSKAIVFEHMGIRVAIVVVDICIMPSDFMADVKKRIEKTTNIIPENIMLSCTHTHGSGDVVGLLGGAVDIAYRNKIPDLITASVLKATEKMKPAKVASGAVDVPEHVLCRRYYMKKEYNPINPINGRTEKVKTNPNGVEHLIDHPVIQNVDSELGFLAIKDLDDNWIAILANYCLHYVGDWNEGTITADYYGKFSQLIQKKLNANSDFVGIMSHGTGGDVNIWDFLNRKRYPIEYFKKTELISNDLSDRVVEALDKIKWYSNPKVGVEYSGLHLPIDKPTKQEINASKKILKEGNFNNLKIDAHGMKMIYAREQLLLNEYTDTHTSSVQTIRIGNLIIGASGAELFSETGLWLKENSPITYFTHCLANTYDGYVAPAHEIELGGYETWRARSSFLASGSEEVIRNKILELINKLL